MQLLTVDKSRFFGTIFRSASCLNGLTLKIIRVMKITAILLFAACLQVSARTEGQVITLTAKNSPLEKVLVEIEKQSGYSFIYGNDLIDKADRVSIEVKNLPLENVLALVFQNQALG